MVNEQDSATTEASSEVESKSAGMNFLRYRAARLSPKSVAWTVPCNAPECLLTRRQNQLFHHQHGNGHCEHSPA